jgi:superfamily II DNA/RNA helicase
VAAALERRGLATPTEVQRLAARAMVGGSDAVVVAETGTGKTLAYLAPLAARELDARAARLLTVASSDGGASAAAPAASNDGVGGNGQLDMGQPRHTAPRAPSPRRRREGPSGIVVVPSHDLAVQVAAVYNSLTAGSPSPLTAALVTGSAMLEVGPSTAMLVGASAHLLLPQHAA